MRAHGNISVFILHVGHSIHISVFCVERCFVARCCIRQLAVFFANCVGIRVMFTVILQLLGGKSTLKWYH